MKTFKVLEKSSGIFGITFEDLGILLTVTLVIFFFLNLLNIWFQIPGWLYLIAISSVGMLLIMVKRSNKQKTPQYLLSKVAWYRIPKCIYNHRYNSLLHDKHAIQPEKKRR